MGVRGSVREAREVDVKSWRSRRKDGIDDADLLKRALDRELSADERARFERMLEQITTPPPRPEDSLMQSGLHRELTGKQRVWALNVIDTRPARAPSKT